MCLRTQGLPWISWLSSLHCGLGFLWIADKVVVKNESVSGVDQRCARRRASSRQLIQGQNLSFISWMGNEENAEGTESIRIWCSNTKQLLIERRLTLLDSSSMRKWSSCTSHLFFSSLSVPLLPAFLFSLSHWCNVFCSDILFFLTQSFSIALWFEQHNFHDQFNKIKLHALGGTYREPSWHPQSSHWSPSPSVHCSLQAFCQQFVRGGSSLPWYAFLTKGESSRAQPFIYTLFLCVCLGVCMNVWVYADQRTWSAW